MEAAGMLTSEDGTKVRRRAVGMKRRSTKSSLVGHRRGPRDVIRLRAVDSHKRETKSRVTVQAQVQRHSYLFLSHVQHNNTVKLVTHPLDFVSGFPL
jgi:hypothetical protein